MVRTIIFLTFLAACSGKPNPSTILKQQLFDDQILNSSDLERDNIILSLYEANLKLGEIVKVKPAIEEEFNRFGQASQLKGDQRIYLQNGEIISIVLTNGTIMKQSFQDGKRYDMFYITTESGIGEAMSVFEFENDTTIKVLSYHKNLIEASKVSIDPLTELEPITFSGDNWTLFAKQIIIVNYFGKPKAISWYHENNPYNPNDKPTEVFEYDERGALIRKTFTDDIQTTYSYNGDLLSAEVETTIMSRDKTGRPESKLVTKKNFQYFPDNSKWTKRIETRTSSFVENETEQPLVRYFILEKK